MRTNNFSSRRFAKSLAIVTLLAVCFVFAFAMTWSLASYNASKTNDVTFADDNDQGTTAGFYGDHGNITAAMFKNSAGSSTIGFPGTSSGTTTWTYEETFSTVYFSPDDNTSIHVPTSGIGSTEVSYTPGTGQFGFNGPAKAALAYDIYTASNYRIPTFIQNILGNSNITVNAQFSANVTRNNGSTSGIFIMASDSAVSASTFPSNAYSSNPYKAHAKEGTGNINVNMNLTAGNTVVVLVAFGDNLIWQKINVEVSNIRVKFTITMSNPSDNSSYHCNDGADPFIASQIDSSALDVYTPYNNSTNQINGSSTWPVWYDSIRTKLSSAVDSMSVGAGRLVSYTNKSLGNAPAVGSSSAQAYYKSSVVEYVDAYNYMYKGSFANIAAGTGDISLADAKKTMGLGDKFASGVSDASINWTTGDSNKRYAAGIKTVQVGDATDGAETNPKAGAIFNVYDTGLGSTSSAKSIYVDGIVVGCATVTRTNRARVKVNIYMYTNADVTTKVTDFGDRSVANKISYKGIDRVNPNSALMDSDTQSAHYMVAPGANTSATTTAVNNMNWWRSLVFSNSTDITIDDSEGEANFSPYIWFYRVDRANTLSALLSVPERSYANYEAIKTDGLEPIAVGSFDNFEYDFSDGTAKGINSARVASKDSATNAIKSGYYRFTFFTFDLAGNMGAKTTYFAKADYDNPTFDTIIKYEYPNGSDSWRSINATGEGAYAKNGAWAIGETNIILTFETDGKSFINANGTNISGNTLIFEAGADVFGVVFNENSILKRIEGSNVYDVNSTTTTFIKKVETDADNATLKIDYDYSNGRLIMSFTDAPSQNGYPNIDWATSFTMYAGVDYENDYEVTAQDGWSGGVLIRVDRNAPEIPELLNVEDGYISELLQYSTSVPKNNRLWYTETGLRLDAILDFVDNLAESYGSGVKVYIGLKTVTSDADFTDGVNNLVYFAQNYKTIAAADYSNYFGTNLAYVDGGSLDDGGQTDVTLRLDQTAGAGMRVIFVWAVDQAGNVSNELSKYFVLADETTYTINSSVKANSTLPSGSAILEQTNADGDTVTAFKRGEVITFSLDMDTDIYAPYLFTKTDGSSSNMIILANYKAEYDWLVDSDFTDNIERNDGSLSFSYYLDDYTTVGALSTMANKKIAFEFAHRKIVEYTVTNSTSVPFTNAPTVVEMATEDAARSSFEYYYLDEAGDPIVGAPIYPNSADHCYKVAIYIPTNNPSFVTKNIVTKVDPTAVPTVDGNYLNVGFQTVAFINYTIVKGNVTITALSSSTNYGAAVVLDYSLTGLDKADAIANGFVCNLKLNADSSDYTTLSVGDYQIIQDGAPYISEGHENFLQYYNINYISAFHKIYTRPITISTVAANKVYGYADPDFEFTVALDQFENAGQLLSFFGGFTENTGARVEGVSYTFYSGGIIRRANGENVGEYSYVANSSMFDVNTNYSLSITNTAKFNITKRTVLLNVAAQSVVKATFDPDNDYTSIVPTFTLSQADSIFAEYINGSLALDPAYVSVSAGTYDDAYKYDVVRGTIQNTANITFEIDGAAEYVVYVYADAILIRLRSDAAFNFVYGTPWTPASLIEYDESIFEGLETGCEVSWTASIDGYSSGNILDVGSYLVKISNIAVTKEGNPVNKVFVDSFNVTFVPAVVGVRPTATKYVKAYGEADIEYGFGWEIATINGEAVGTDYAGNLIADIRSAISGAYARALYTSGTFDALGTRYDDAADANGVLYSNANKYYAYAIGAEFVSANPNFQVDARLGEEDAAKRFEISRKELVLNSTMFTGLSKVVDGSVNVNYEAAGVKIVELRDMLVLPTDDVNLTYTNAYYDDPSTGLRTITFNGLYLVGAKAANYILTVTDLTEGSVTIAYIDNASDDTSNENHIKIIDGLVGLHRSDITIKKQYDGTNALDISNIVIQNRTENNIGTSMLVSIMSNGNAEVKSGEFSASNVNNSYVLNIVLFFKVTDPDIIFVHDYNEAGLTIEKANLDNEWGVRVAVSGIGGEIEKRVINSSSFASITPRTRDYNAHANVDIDYVFADGAIVAGDNVNVTFAGEITTVDVGYGEHPIRFTSGAVSNSNYRIDLDELNSRYNEASPLKVQIERAKLIINKVFKGREYNGSADIEVEAASRDNTANDFTTLHYATELQSELSLISIDGDPVFKLSNKGAENANVMRDGDGDATLHDVMIKGLKLAGGFDFANYELYGFRYAGDQYMAVGSVPSGVVEDFELLGEVLITKKHVSIVENDIDVHDKVYDGTKNASTTINVNELDDIVAADKPYLRMTAHGEFDQKYVGYSVNVRISGVTLKAVDTEHNYLLGNYEITNASDVVLQRKIYARPVTFSFDLGSRVYSGDTYVSSNVIRETVVGLLPVDVKSYGIQVAGGAYFRDKNVAFEENENGEYKRVGDDYILLTTSELESYAGTRYSIGSKPGTIYNPIIRNTKAVYVNYVLTYAIDKADYVSGEYLYVKMTDGSILYYSDSTIDVAEIETYYFALKQAKKYILASDDAKLAAAGDENIVGFYNYNNQGVYLVVDGYTGETSGELPDYVSYSNDARGKIQKRAAIINEIEVLDTTHFTKDYDGTTKFNGVAGVDYSYASTGMGLAGDDLEIVGVIAEFESASVGDTYVVIRADHLGGADANNYTYGTLRSARIPAKINKIKITAHLADGNMVYGTNLANVVGDITYTLGGKDLDFSDRGVMIKFEDFLKVVGILGVDDSIADLTEEDIRVMTELLQRIYIKDGDEYSADPVVFDKNSADADKYYARLGGSFTSMPKTSVLFPVARPSAGTTSSSYTLKGGEAANFSFAFEYTDGDTSHLTVVKRDIYVVAAIEDYQKEYGGIEPTITLNYLDANGRPAIVSGETWRNVFVVGDTDYRPDVYFSLFVDGVSDGTPIPETAKISADPNLNGDYVLVIKSKEGFVAANYEIHYANIVLLDATAEKNERYGYQFEGTGFTAKAPELTIVMPTISGVSLKEGTTFTSVYNRFSQAGLPLNGVKDSDVVKMVDSNDQVMQVVNAGTYVGVVVLEREVFENDPNGYKLVWRSDVDGGVLSLTIEIAKASPNLSAPRGSEQYNGQAHTYPYTRATVAAGLPMSASRFTTRYTKKVDGNYVDIDTMRDSGVYLIYLTYDSGNANYETQTIEIQFAITKAKVVVDIDYTTRQLYEAGKGYQVDFTITSITPATNPALLTNNDLMVQFLLAGEGLLKVENGQVVPVDDSVISIQGGKYVFGHSGKYPFQVILKDSALKENFDITQNVLVDNKITSTTATGALELVVQEIDYVVDEETRASIKVKDSDNLEKNLLADKFEARYVYKNNVLADDDAYYAAVDSAFMAEVEKALGTSVTISAIIRYNLSLTGNSVGLNSTPSTISVEVPEEILKALDSTVIYQTVLNSDGTTALRRLSGYEIKDGILTYDTTTLGSIVFVRAGREVPMIAVWVGVAVGGVAVIIIASTLAYIAAKKRRLKKELL